MQSPPWANLVTWGTLLGRPVSAIPCMVTEEALVRRPAGAIPSLAKLGQRKNFTRAPIQYNPLPVPTLCGYLYEEVNICQLDKKSKIIYDKQ